MSKFLIKAFARLDELVEKHGNEYIHEKVMERLFNGDSPTKIAREEFDLPYTVLKGWLELNAPESVALVGRARADELEFKATNAVENANPDTLGVVKLQANHFMKLAGKLDRAKFGDKPGDVSVAVQVNNGIIPADISPQEAAKAYAVLVGKRDV